jgi:hypothetical protein
LAPGDYKVKLELDGYWTWEKELAIKAGETTYLEDVRFFKQNLPQLINNAQLNKISAAQFSSDSKYFAYNDADQIKVIDLANKQNTQIGKNTASRISWSANSKYILEGSTIREINTNKSIELENKLNQKIRKAIWSADDDNLLCLQTNSGILVYDINKQDSRLLLSITDKKTTVTDCLIKNSDSYLLKNVNSKSILSITKSGQDKESGIIELPRQADYQFVNTDNKWINIFDPNSQKISIIETHLPWSTDYNIKTLPSNARLSHWIDKDRLLLASDFDLYINNINDNNEKILTRVSSPIKAIFWHPSKNYVIFINEQGIYALELDNRDRHNITRLLELNGIQNAHMDNDGKNIYFTGQIGQQQGLWQLEL